MKKIFTLFAAIGLTMSLSAATIFNFSDSVDPQTVDGFTVTLSKGAGSTPPAVYDNGVRLYASNTITVAGEGITKIELTFAKQGKKDYAGLTASADTLKSGGESTSVDDLKTDVWTGSANSVVFTLGTSGQRLIKRVIINRADDEDFPTDSTDTDEPETPTELDTTYVYAEPTVVGVPATTVQGAPYSFIQNNIKVDCSKGAIAETYFSCYAANTISFTATKNIKGLVVKGYVKKDFEATVDKGEIVYATTDDPDGLAADPVMVVKNIDAQNVTISCVKQLRLYTVKFYFEANPEDSVSGGVSGEGEVFFETYNAADVVYESEMSEEDAGLFNYSVYLYNDTVDYPYIALDLWTTVKDSLEGVYTLDDGNLGEYTYLQYGEAYEDYSDATEGSVVVLKQGNQWTINGYITCRNKNTYNFTYTGEIEIVLDTDYYEDDEAIENTEAQTKANKQLRNCQLIIVFGDRTYTVTGQRIR